jgi:hypothetical protein
MRHDPTRYAKDFRRQLLAVRFLIHEARTSTVCTWTGLSPDQVRHMRRYGLPPRVSPDESRPRGPLPRQVVQILKSPRLRLEAATLAGLCRLLDVIPATPLPHAGRVLPNVSRGELLCVAFERFSASVPAAHLTLEQLVLIVIALAQADEFELGHCPHCGAVIVIDRLGNSRRACSSCRGSTAGIHHALTVEDLSPEEAGSPRFRQRSLF